MQGRESPSLAPRGAEQAAASHQVEIPVKGEGRAQGAQALFSQLVSVIFVCLGTVSECHNSSAGHSSSQETLTQFSVAHPCTAGVCLFARWRQVPPGRPEEQFLTDSVTNFRTNREKRWNHELTCVCVENENVEGTD